MVVLGAGAEQARGLVPEGVQVIVADGWSRGLSASLQTGLGAVAAVVPPPFAVLVALVDTPGLNAAVVRRLVDLAGADATVLARAVYRGAPGHPVLIGRDHWQRVARAAAGDSGAAVYLRAAGAESVERSDVADGSDVDGPDEDSRPNSR